MIGVLMALVVAMCGFMLGTGVFSKLIADRDPALRFGLACLLGLATLGTGLFLVGWLIGFSSLSVVFLALACVQLLDRRTAAERLSWLRFKPTFWVTAFAIPLHFALVGALGPSDSLDWDSLAYHLAVPKLWLEHGKIDYIPYIHHSNFPFAIDSLFLVPLMSSGGEAGAKLIVLLFTVFGCFAIFGFAREKYSQNAGYWAVLAFLGIPVTLWESGTAYIDVAHGLFAGLGLVFAAEALTNENKKSVWLAALLLGFAVASKYTGLQMAFVAALVVAVGFALQKRALEGLRIAAIIGFIAVAMGLPWFVRNVVNTGNPVYPFFYETFKGSNWDQRRADVYRNEQLSFGVGVTPSGKDWSQLPHSLLGLAYQPGRYVNPNPAAGTGFPIGAAGVAVLCGYLLWCVSGKCSRFEKSVLGGIGVGLVVWFALSQQSRYGVNLMIPGCILAGGAVSLLRMRVFLQVVMAAQLAYSTYLCYLFHFEPKLPVLLGRQSREEYLADRVGFSLAAKYLHDTRAKRVALYGEVFGYLLDFPYIWADSGHSLVFDYDNLSTGEEYANELKRLEVSHVYVNLQSYPPEARKNWLIASGLEPGQVDQPQIDLEMQNFELKPRWLIADAIKSGRLKVAFANGPGVVLLLVESP